MITEEQLKKMKDSGDLTDEEYEKALNIQNANSSDEKQSLSPQKIKQIILFSVVILGLFSVLSGLGLIIAANWQIIPKELKVLGGLGIFLLSLGAVSYFNDKAKNTLKEAFLFISFLLVGANIALIQQTYNLTISWTEGSFIWWVLSFPFLFYTKKLLLPLCSIALFVFAIWHDMFHLNYMITAGILFILMMLSHFSNGKIALFIRYASIILMILVIIAGDLTTHSSLSVVGTISSLFFGVVALAIPYDKLGVIRRYNLLFLFVAWRIFLLFWTAYANLMNLGVALIIFGTVLLATVGFYTYYYDQIQNTIKRFISHEK